MECVIQRVCGISILEYIQDFIAQGPEQLAVTSSDGWMW